jgi:hypothetical protein
MRGAKAQRIDFKFQKSKIMKSFSKTNLFAAAFEVSADGKLSLRDGVRLPDKIATSAVKLPRELAKGIDYLVIEKAGALVAVASKYTAADPFDVAYGGFHVGLDGKIVALSIWDAEFRPSCPDPRGMALIADLFWCDIYLTGEDGNSRAGSTIADGDNPPFLAPGIKADRFNFWIARDLLASKGKQLLSAAEFALAADGVTQNKTAGRDPKKTGYIAGLRSTAGLEQATGCMWTWSRDLRPWGGVRLLGGYWNTSVAGPRRLSVDSADGSFGYVGARGRCDHLILG